MTNKDMAVAIDRRVIQFQAQETAANTLLSRIRVDGQSIPWQDQLKRDTDHDLSPELPLGRWLADIESALDQSSPDEVLETLYRELFDRS